ENPAWPARARERRDAPAAGETSTPVPAFATVREKSATSWCGHGSALAAARLADSEHSACAHLRRPEPVRRGLAGHAARPLPARRQYRIRSTDVRNRV